MKAPEQAKSRPVSGQYARAWGRVRKMVVLVRRKGLLDIVKRRLLEPAGLVRQKQGLPFVPYQPRRGPTESRVRVASLLDPVLSFCLRYDAELEPLLEIQRKSELESFAPRFVLVASRGLTPLSDGSKHLSSLDERLGWCRDLGIPRVLWIDDQVRRFDGLVRRARAFDWVFASDSETAARFAAELDSGRVGVLPLAVQPVLHNPMDRANVEQGACWLGSLDEVLHMPESDPFRRLVVAATRRGLDVFEVLPPGAAARLGKPRAREGRRGALNYERVLTAYRAYPVFLVGPSGDLAARRTALELSACGARLIGAGGDAMPPVFAPALTLVQDDADVGETLRESPRVEANFGVAAHLAYREAHAHNSYEARLSELSRRLGAGSNSHEPPLVSVLTASNRPENLETLLENFERQSHPRLELILLLNSDAYQLGAVEARVARSANVRVFQLEERRTLAECLNLGIQHASGSWIAKFDDDDLYGSRYLADLLLCSRFTTAQVLGKRAYHVHFEASQRTALRFGAHGHRHVNFVHGGTLLVRREVFDQVSFSPVQRGTDTIFQRQARERGFCIYSSDPFNFVHVRHESRAGHTWAISDEELLGKCSRIRSGLPLDEIMI